MTQHHTCEDHGHHCPICEEQRLKEERLSEIRATVDSWNWNASIFDIYETLKDMDEEDQEEHLRIAIEVIPSSESSFRDLALHLGVSVPAKPTPAPISGDERKRLWAENGEYRRHCALKQAIDWLGICHGRMEACHKQHPEAHQISVEEVPQWIAALREVYDNWSPPDESATASGGTEP